MDEKAESRGCDCPMSQRQPRGRPRNSAYSDAGQRESAERRQSQNDRCPLHRSAPKIRAIPPTPSCKYCAQIGPATCKGRCARRMIGGAELPIPNLGVKVTYVASRTSDYVAGVVVVGTHGLGGGCGGGRRGQGTRR